MVAMSKDALKGPAMLANGAIVGSLVVFLLSTLMATVVFDQPSANTTVPEQEIQMAMQVFPTEQHIKVWMDAVIPLQILVDIVNISKIDPDGNAEPGGLVDLFPVGDPSNGKGSIIFKMAAVDKTVMPDLLNRTQEVIPMAYIKESTFVPIVRSILKLGAVSLNNIGLITGLAVISSLGMIAAGAALVFLDVKKKKSSVTVVS